MSNSLVRTEPDVNGRGRSSGAIPVFDRLAELEKRVLAMDKHSLEKQAYQKAAYAISAPDIAPVDPADTRLARQSNISVSRSLDDFESRLPQLIEKEVNVRFQQMTATLQREVEETNLRAIETFVQHVQAKLVQRISLLEANMNKQAQTMSELRECSRRTEDNLVRLISGVEKLARELPARVQARS